MSGMRYLILSTLHAERVIGSRDFGHRPRNNSNQPTVVQQERKKGGGGCSTTVSRSRCLTEALLLDASAL